MRASRSQVAALAVLCGIAALTFLDTTVVSITLADIQTDLHAGVTTLQWVVNGYALVFASFMLAGGTLGDRLGRRSVMVGGVGVFCAGAIVCALAPNSSTLIAGRVVMGIGAAASEPGTLSVLRHLYPEHRARAGALGAWAATSGLALALGPVIGGVIAGLSSWRGIFWFSLVWGVLVGVLAMRVVEESSDPEEARLDIAGMVLGVATLAPFVFAVIAGETAGYGPWWIITLFCVSALGAVAFAIVEHRVEKPLVPLDLFRRAAFVGANVVGFITYFALFAIFFFVALYLQLIANESALRVALDFAPLAGGMIVASAATGRWVGRVGARLPMATGCILGGVGALLTDRVLSPHVGLLSIGSVLLVSGVGFGMAVVPVVSSALSAVAPERSGLAASVTNTFREMGAVVGVAVLGAIVNAQLTSYLTMRLRQLGVPSGLWGFIIGAVTTGTAPSSGANNPAAAGNAALVAKVIAAADQAFYVGLNVALLLAASLLLAAGLVAAASLRNRPAEEEAPDAAAVGSPPATLH
jgi:EmrB/QacA subfamily drug resistance transporter